MFYFILRRLVSLIPVGIGVVTIVSVLIDAVPGNPIDTLSSPFASLEDKKRLATALGLDKGVFERLWFYLLGVLQGDLGTSLIYSRPVSDLILERFFSTFELASFALFFAIVFSVPMGILSAVRKGTWIDHITMTFALFGICVPNFFLGPMLVLLFSIKLDLLPVSEKTNFLSYILPSLSLGVALAAALSRISRASVIECLKEDYVRTARSKGLKQNVILFKHVLRNASLPIITIIGLQFGVLLTGAIITERIFDWPGLGTLMLEGINNRDYPLVQGCVLVFSGTYLLVNLITDLIYSLCDPRIKIS